MSKNKSWGQAFLNGMLRSMDTSKNVAVRVPKKTCFKDSQTQVRSSMPLFPYPKLDMLRNLGKSLLHGDLNLKYLIAQVGASIRGLESQQNVTLLRRK